jgi:hypothetical protein
MLLLLRLHERHIHGTVRYSHTPRHSAKLALAPLYCTRHPLSPVVNTPHVSDTSAVHSVFEQQKEEVL